MSVAHFVSQYVPSDRDGVNETLTHNGQEVATVKRVAFNQYADCIVANILPNNKFDTKIAGVTEINNIVPQKQLKIGDRVWKYGRSTKFTDGEIILSDSSHIAFRIKNRKVYKQNHIFVKGKNSLFSDEGDSGAMVLDFHNNIIGMLIGTTTMDGAEITVIAPWQAVARECRVKKIFRNKNKDEL